MKLSRKVPLNINKAVVNKIKYLCHRAPEIEWCGKIYYKIEGSFEEEPVIEIVDLYPMSIDTAAGTEIDYSQDTSDFSYTLDNSLMDCRQGHIHSHNKMSVFFSTTDEEDLCENGQADMNCFYLSLIVNNAGEMCARIAYEIEVEDVIEQKIAYKDEVGILRHRVFSSNELVKYVGYNECDIKSNIYYDVNTSFVSRVDALFTVRKEKLEALSKKSTYPTYYGSEDYKVIGFNQNKHNHQFYKDKKNGDKQLTLFPEVFFNTNMKVEDFLIMWLGDMTDRTLDDALNSLKTEIDIVGGFNNYKDLIENSLNSTYYRYIDDGDNSYRNMYYNKCIRTLEEYSAANLYIDDVIKMLKNNMINKKK